MNNLKAIISRHNKITLRFNSEHDKEKLCNCRTKNSCPLKNKCLQKNVIYKATVKSENDVKNYISSTGNTLKQDVTAIIVIF